MLFEGLVDFTQCPHRADVYVIACRPKQVRPCVVVHKNRHLWVHPYFFCRAQHFLLVLLGGFVRWEVSRCTAVISRGAISRVCSKQYVPFLFSYHLAFSPYFDIVAGVLQGDTLAPYLFIICLDYVLRTSIDKIRQNGFELTKKRSRRYPAKTITDADYADDIAILANTPNQAETLLHSLERAAAGIGLYVNAHKTEYMCYNQTGDISSLDGTPLKLVDKFTYLGSSVSSTEKDIDTRLTKAWTAINRLSIIWKSDLTDKMKRSFFQAAVASILLYGCTTWTLTKRLEKKLDGNYTRMLRAILNKSWRQHPTRHQLYGHLPPITKTIQVRRTRHAGHCWRSRDELISDVLLWTPTHGRAKAGRPARTYIQQLCEDTGCCPEDLPEAINDREKWRERESGISVLPARHDDIYICHHKNLCGASIE